MVRRLGLGKNNHLTYASLALNPRSVQSGTDLDWEKGIGNVKSQTVKYTEIQAGSPSLSDVVILLDKTKLPSNVATKLQYNTVDSRYLDLAYLE